MKKFVARQTLVELQFIKNTVISIAIRHLKKWD